MSSTSNEKATTRKSARRSSCVQGAIPAYGVADGVQSWRYELRARERATVDRALAILGGYLREAGYVFRSTEVVRQYLILHLAADSCERFSVLYLDSQNCVIAYECHFSGTLTQTSVYPREIVVAALKHRAAAVVFAHNHPSGNPTPSRADEVLTQTLKNALLMVDVRVLDHFIVAGTQAFSMAEHGLI